MKYKVAIFDMDGTILDTLDDLTYSLNYALSKSNYPTRSKCEVRSFVGNGIKRLVERGVPREAQVAAVDTVYHDFTVYYQEHCGDKTKPYDGILMLLQSLREHGCQTAVVSNKADNAVQELCNQYFPKMFDYAIGERNGIRKKPAPDTVFETLRQLGLHRKDAVYIGDSEVDIQTANNANMDSIIVDWGFRDRDVLLENGAEIIVSRPMEIKELIEEVH